MLFRSVDDIFVGTAGNDVINGLGGNDTLNGMAGDDILIGGAGADTLNGGAGADTLDGRNDAAADIKALRSGSDLVTLESRRWGHGERRPTATNGSEWRISA